MKYINSIMFLTCSLIIFWTWALNFPWSWVLYVMIVIQILLFSINFLCLENMESTAGWLPVISLTYSVVIQGGLFIFMGVFRLLVTLFQWIF